MKTKSPKVAELRTHLAGCRARVSDLEIEIKRLWRKIMGHTECRRSVQWFAVEMEKKLQENDHKGGWADEDDSYLIGRLQDEVVELKNSLRMFPTKDQAERTVKEAADVANFAMMIAEQYTAGIGGE